MVVAVHTWDQSHPKDQVKDWVEKQKLKQKVLINGSPVEAKFGVRANPTTFWIDHESKVLTREVGFSPLMVASMEKKIEKLLAKKKAAAKG